MPRASARNWVFNWKLAAKGAPSGRVRRQARRLRPDKPCVLISEEATKVGKNLALVFTA